ncbi:hypothetical protein LOTGIDRAFT_176767, partial [Lottia gigantea]
MNHVTNYWSAGLLNIGWGEKEDNVHPVRSRSPPTSQYHPENTTHEPRIYQPSKYNLVSGGGSHYDSTYRDYSAPTREGTVQYLSSDGYEKNRILQLEEDCSLNETRLKHALINQDDTGDTLHHKIQ